MARGEYLRWPTVAKIPLLIGIQADNGAGLPGKAPEVAVIRYRETNGGPLDGYFWDGVSGFQATANWIVMSEFDATNNPGVYEYLFDQDLLGLEHVYLVYYRHSAIPIGMASEFHVVTNDIYTPSSE